MKKNRIGLLFALLPVFCSHAQQAEVISNYINTYKDLAIAEMQRTGVPAAIKLAQGIHETTAGTSKLVLKSNNHFGIKCKTNWAGESVTHDDDARGECFRKYPSAGDSYRDHSDFLKNSQRYASLFTLDPADYEGWANGLKKAGYATNPRYPLVLIKLIEDYHLQDYTLVGLGKSPVQEEVTALVNPDTGKNETTVVKKGKEETASKKTSYPAGQFKINDTKVIYVTQGTAFLAIANQYDVPLSRIFEFNELDETEESGKDQLIYLQRKRKSGNNDYHIIQPGETLHDIAQQEAIRLESLLELNWLKQGEMPAAGETLSLRKKSSVMPKLALKENYSLVPVQTNRGN